MAHENEGLVRGGYEAFRTGDLDTLKRDFAEDIRWHTPGNNPISGDIEGRDAVFQQFAKLAELSGGTFSLDLHDVIANDEHAVALVTARGSRNGVDFEDNQVHVFHVKDGVVTEFWGHPGDQAKTDQFWS